MIWDSLISSDWTTTARSASAWHDTVKPGAGMAGVENGWRGPTVIRHARREVINAEMTSMYYACTAEIMQTEEASQRERERGEGSDYHRRGYGSRCSWSFPPLLLRLREPREGKWVRGGAGKERCN